MLQNKVRSAVYSITNSITSKIYIGSAVNYKRRWNLHIRELNTKIHSNAKLQNAWNKYGASAFTFAIVEYVPDRSKLLEIEQIYLDSLKAVDEGYNICRIAGSCLGVKRSEKALANLKASHTPEVREKRAKKLRGFKHSDESKKNMRDAQNQEETRAKRVKSLTGRKMSQEAVQKSSIGRIGQKRSEDAKSLMSEKASKFSYEQCTLNGEFIRLWISAKELRESGFDYARVSRVCSDKYPTHKTHKGFIWKKIPKII